MFYRSNQSYPERVASRPQNIGSELVGRNEDRRFGEKPRGHRRQDFPNSSSGPTFESIGQMRNYFDITHGRPKIGMVQNVEQFGPKLQGEPLVNRKISMNRKSHWVAPKPLGRYDRDFLLNGVSVPSMGGRQED